MRILVLGLGISGKSAVDTLLKLGHTVSVYDDFINSEADVPDNYKNRNINYIFNFEDILSKQYDYVMKSPGIKPINGAVSLIKQANYRIISDIELGYMLKGKSKLLAVTGTNGKTTTTTLINEILNKCGKTSSAIGNIGVGAISDFVFSEDEYLVIECSSFQLDDIYTFKPDISIITNITVDHLDYHGDYNSYIRAKLNVLENQLESDLAILNYDDEILRNLSNVKAEVIFVSGLHKLENGIWYENGYINISENYQVIFQLECDKVFIKGMHNYYNIMYALAVAYKLDLNLEAVQNAIYKFKGVPHRLEFVADIKGIKYYNDSKGTNPDSTEKAIDSFVEPIVIILGGYDKKVDFTPLLQFGKDKIKAIVTLGETKNLLYDTAIGLGYDKVFIVDTLKDAVHKSNELATDGDIILLSPACASWDMFKNYEVRGNEFIDIVRSME